MNTSISSNRTSIGETTRVALVAALYVTVTVLFAVISFGAIQLRLSEMFNYLALYHKRYVVAVTLGVVLANFFSPTWFMDVPIGGIATLLVLLLCRAATKNMKNDKLKITITAVLFALSMFTVAMQLKFILGLPFWATYATVALGELFSMAVGGFIIFFLSRKIDFNK